MGRVPGGARRVPGPPREGRVGRPARTVVPAVVGVVLLASMVGLALWAPWREEAPEPRVPTSSSTTASAGARTAPLTGAPVAADGAAVLSRPALVAKIDAAGAAMPQTGLERADVVVELRVEGISRYMAVWHSRSPGEVGPVRSARTSDADLLQAFGHPLFAFSGGNEGTLRALRGAGGFQDASVDVAPAAYWRERSRSAPHDLYADASALWSVAEDGTVPPTPLFTYRPAGTPAEGEAVAGVSVRVGTTAVFAWDEQRRGWRRWVEGRPHRDDEGEQLAPTNVVVLETAYVTSAADPTSPEAVSVGTGRAWVLSDGREAEGTWRRTGAAAPWDLRGADGASMTLEAGTTWVVLADEAPRVRRADQLPDR